MPEREWKPERGGQTMNGWAAAVGFWTGGSWEDEKSYVNRRL